VVISLLNKDKSFKFFKFDKFSILVILLKDKSIYGKETRKINYTEWEKNDSLYLPGPLSKDKHKYHYRS